MEELGIRRNGRVVAPRYQGVAKAEKQATAAQPQRASGRAAATVSETLMRLMGQVTRTGRQVREGRRALQSGEAALAEVEDALGRMEELAKEAAGDGAVDRSALQKVLEQLRGEIERIAQGGVRAGLFRDGDGPDGADALIDAVMDGLSTQEGAEGLPAWLAQGITGDAPDPARLLAALGLDGNASAAQVLAALGKAPLEDNAAAGYLAALYLGAVISGGTPTGSVDISQAAEGLRQFLEAVADGMTPDEAIELLTGGVFTSMEDFQAQFMDGTAPGLEPFLMELLFSGEALLEEPSLLAVLAGGGGDMELLMNLLLTGGGLGELPDGAGAAEAAQAGVPHMETMELETIQASGRDLSGVDFDPQGGTLTVDGGGDVILRGLGQAQEQEQAQGQGQKAPALRLAPTAEGTVKLHQVSAPLLDAQGPRAHVAGAGENTLAQVRLGADTVLTVDGGGLVRVGVLEGGANSVLRLAGGVVVLGREVAQGLLKPDPAVDGGKNLPMPLVVVDGPVSLLAAEGIAVRNAQGEPLEPFDVLWKALLPDWDAVTAMSVDGRQGQMPLRADNQPDWARLWLLKGDDSKGWPAHTIALRGRDKMGRPQVRYVYVRWDEREGGFQEIPMYPNPFTVTGGEPDVDWRYEEETQTLRILSGEVTAISGGAGTDANALPFSGRIALADGIGRVELTLDGVECRVSAGRAFYLGRKNDVILLLQSGTENVFESGEGCAGISLGKGTSLRVDRVKGVPEGTLTAVGGSGGAGIGRDSGAGQERTGPIVIQGGVITATGAGGGAGIGGALGAAVGDIRIQGGTVTALADCCAAAIGAGIQGACGDIAITGSAKVLKAQGGGPDGDIGGCLFGNCGKVQVSDYTDLGGAKLWTQKGFSIQVGEASVTMPRFRVTARALRLDAVNLTTREAARAALGVLSADRRWVTRLQGAYGAMYGQLGQSFSSMYSAHRSVSVVRDTGEASSLACDIREVLRQSPKAIFLTQRGMEDVGQLLR